MSRMLRVAGCLSWLAVGVTVVPAGAWAEETRLTLSEAVARALRDGTEARIARLEADQADDALAEAWSSLWPHVAITSLAGYSNRLDEKLRAVDSRGVERTYGLDTLASDRGWFNFFIDQLVFDLRTWRQIERTQLEAEVARVAEAEQREVISLAVFERYINVLRLEQLVDLAGGCVEEAKWLDGQAAILFKAGRALPSVRDQVALNLEEARMDEALLAQGLADARAALRLAIGDGNGHQPLLLVRDSVSTPEVVSPDAAAGESLAVSPDLRILELRRRMEEVNIKAAKAERYPTLEVQAGYSHFGVKRFDNFPDEIRIGVDLEMPLFDGFKARSSIEGALKAAEIARLRYRSMLEAKRARVRDLSRRLAAAQRRPELAARRARISRERLRLADLNLQENRGTLDNALAARTAAALDASTAVDTHYDNIVLWGNLKRATGQLAAAIIGDDPESTER